MFGCRVQRELALSVGCVLTGKNHTQTEGLVYREVAGQGTSRWPTLIDSGRLYHRSSMDWRTDL